MNDKLVRSRTITRVINKSDLEQERSVYEDELNTKYTDKDYIMIGKGVVAERREELFDLINVIDREIGVEEPNEHKRL